MPSGPVSSNSLHDAQHPPNVVGESIEMDALPQAPTHGRSISRGRRSVLVPDKIIIPREPPELNKKDYAIGIVLLLSVVVLWTSSNFITQVSVAHC